MPLLLFIIAASISLASPALAVEFSCEQAQWAARNFSREQLEVMGRWLGLTDADRAKAFDCLTVQPQPRAEQKVIKR